MTNKPSIPQGTRDFSAEVVRKRNYIFSVIRNVFELYSFQPLETPAMENLDTLMGKYGEEGDKLIFKILNNGINNEKNIEKSKAGFEKLLEGKNSSDITERALKYDLTIPFARYVAMNHTKLIFPFRRYQIQPVWRADRPQKGRYREFTQCDADVVGSNSLLNEIELILIIDKVFTNLTNYFSDNDDTHVIININNRKIWAGIAQLCGCPDKIIEITIALDKFDKIGKKGVKEELVQKGFKKEQIELIFDCLFPNEIDYLVFDDDYLKELNLTKFERNLAITIYGYNPNLYVTITCLLWNFNQNKIEIGISGVKEILQVLSPFFMDTDNFFLQSAFINIDSTLARGLNYYTGTIIEVKAPPSVNMGSIGGGGRYDDLTGLFGVPNIPGVGISFGVDRIYDVLEELNLFPQDVQVSTRALFFNMGEAESNFAFGIMQQLRSSGISCELFHEATKINKQFTYAEKKNIPFVIIIGSKEMEEKNCSVKNLATGNQEIVPFETLADYLKSL